VADFLAPKSPRAAKQAVEAIQDGVKLLETHPFAGQLTERQPGHRDLLIRFGTGGYVVRYQAGGDEVLILWIRHQRERSPRS
jgi:plasmid stabilization system protein ParE